MPQKPPEKIYLTPDEDGDYYWSQDRITKNDIEYVTFNATRMSVISAISTMAVKGYITIDQAVFLWSCFWDNVKKVVGVKNYDAALKRLILTPIRLSKKKPIQIKPIFSSNEEARKCQKPVQ